MKKSKQIPYSCPHIDQALYITKNTLSNPYYLEIEGELEKARDIHDKLRDALKYQEDLEKDLRSDISSFERKVEELKEELEALKQLNSSN